jgi:hypothetical protein
MGTGAGRWSKGVRHGGYWVVIRRKRDDIEWHWKKSQCRLANGRRPPTTDAIWLEGLSLNVE